MYSSHHALALDTELMFILSPPSYRDAAKII
jgi:hypothetical protein